MPTTRWYKYSKIQTFIILTRTFKCFNRVFHRKNPITEMVKMAGGVCQKGTPIVRITTATVFLLEVVVLHINCTYIRNVYITWIMTFGNL